MKEIFERRSVRNYLDKEVPKDMVETIIMAGMAAPSSDNEQPWHFIVVNDKERLHRIADFNPFAKMLKRCNVAIVVCGDLTLAKSEGFWIQDCSAATQNMLLEAVHLGLGAVWVGVYPMAEVVEEVKKVFNLPEEIIPLSIVPLGFPVRTKESAHRYQPSRIRYNSW